MINKLLLYCEKRKPYLYYVYEYKLLNIDYPSKLNGKIVVECDFEVEEINPSIYEMYDGFIYNNPQEEEKLKRACLSAEEMYLYLQDKTGYAIHIKNLCIYDEPKELNEYYKSYDNSKTWKPITKAPRNMMYVDYINIEKNKFIPYILLPVGPQDLCKILNGEKTIIIKKKVLKEML